MKAKVSQTVKTTVKAKAKGKVVNLSKRSFKNQSEQEQPQTTEQQTQKSLNKLKQNSYAISRKTYRVGRYLTKGKYGKKIIKLNIIKPLKIKKIIKFKTVMRIKQGVALATKLGLKVLNSVAMGAKSFGISIAIEFGVVLLIILCLLGLIMISNYY